MRHILWLVLSIGLLSGCDDSGYRNGIAGVFLIRCKQDRDPDPEVAKQMDKECSCIADKIRSSDIKLLESQEITDAKMKKAVASCIGPLDAGDR